MFRRYPIFISAILLFLFNACQQKKAISPMVTTLSPDFIDTLKIEQRSELNIKFLLQDDHGLKSYYYIINDSIYETTVLEGKQEYVDFDTVFHYSGIKDFSLIVKNEQGLESKMFFPILSDSVSRPSIVLLDSDFKTVSASYTTQSNELQFTLITSQGQYPVCCWEISTLDDHNIGTKVNSGDISSASIKDTNSFSVFLPHDTTKFQLVVSDENEFERIKNFSVVKAEK